MVERYGAGPGKSHAGPPGGGTPRVLSTVVLEKGTYYQMRITLQPLAQHWDLGGVNSMLPRDTAVPDGPTTLPPDQPPDPLTTIVSGSAGTWHPGRALYCLWRWAQRRWPHTREWSAAWGFHLEGR